MSFLNKEPQPDVREAISELGLKYGLMTQFTSFVAIEEKVVSEGGKSWRIDVPVPMPDGMSYQGVFGKSRTVSGGEGDIFDWSVPGIWRQMSRITVAVLLTLSIMSLWLIVVMVERLTVFSAARDQSREFASKLASLLESRKIDEAISLSEIYKKSHLAVVIRAGLQRFPDRQLSSDITAEVIGEARSALQRAIASSVLEFRRSLSGLRVICSTAPLVGLSGTLFGITDTFVAMRETSYAGISSVAGGIAEALVTTAIGIAVAVPAFWLFNYFTEKVDNFLLEMETTSDELIDFILKRFCLGFNPKP